jgi:plasmid replication initiation protein
MTFSTELAEFLLELKRVYAKIYLQDLGRLQSRYAIRIFEFAMSFAFLQGKQGNKADEWYFRESVQALRHTMGVSPEAYPETRLFRQKVIEEPVKEINRAGIGFEITTAGVKQGRRLESIEFTCKKSARTTGAKGRSKKKTAPAENPATTAELPTNPLEARFKEDKELEHLRELYPKEFAELYAVEYAKPPLPFNTWNSDRHRDNAVVVACKTLKERHGIVK